MFKFFRKYNAILLVVGGSFLMVAFLLPQALTQLGATGAGATVARFEGGAISGREYQRARSEIQIIQQFTPSFTTGVPSIDRRHPLNGVEGIDHWLLLAYQAEKMGLIGDVRDGRDYLDTLASINAAFLQRRPSNAGTSLAEIEAAERERLEEQLQNVVNNGTPESVVLRALAKLRGVNRMLDSLSMPALVSRSESVAASWDRMSVIVADVGFLAADAETVEELPREELETFYETYKGVAPGEGEYGVGYLQPPAADVEYLQIRTDVLEQAVTIDEVALERFYRARTDTYGDDKESKRSVIERDFRRNRAEEWINELTKSIRRTLLRERAALGDGGLPEDWAAQRPTMEELAAVANTRATELAGAEVEPARTFPSEGNFHSRDELSSLQGIGSASTPQELGSSTAFPAMVMEVGELTGVMNPRVRVGLAEGPLLDSVGNAYFFRVLRVREEGPPESIDDVIEQVRTDAANVTAYERMVEESNLETMIADIDSVESLRAFTDAWGGTLLRNVRIRSTNVSVSPSDSAIQKLNVEPFRLEAMALADSWAPDTVVADLPPEERRKAVPVQSALGVGLVFAQEWKPMTLEMYRSQGSMVSTSIGQTLFTSEAMPTYSFEKLKETLNFRQVGQRTSDDTGEDEADGESGDGGEAPAPDSGSAGGSGTSDPAE